jgi:hypothetical protein
VTETNVLQLSQPGTFADPLRNGARALLTQAVEAEVAAMLGRHADETTEDGRRRLVRQGHLPEREIMTGIGPVAVRCPRVRDRGGEGSERIRFSSAILPPYARLRRASRCAALKNRVLLPCLPARFYTAKTRSGSVRASQQWRRSICMGIARGRIRCSREVSTYLGALCDPA